MNVVVDASVAAMWFLPERHSHNALLLLGPEYDLAAPDLIRAEITSALLRAARLELIGVEHARRSLEEMSRAPVRLSPAVEHVDAAFRLAQRHGGSLYDAIYIALAQSLEAPVVTNDAELAAVATRAGVRAQLIGKGVPHPER